MAPPGVAALRVRESWKDFGRRVASVRCSGAKRPEEYVRDDDDFLEDLLMPPALGQRLPSRHAAQGPHSSGYFEDEGDGSDGERVMICRCCRLPLGSVAMEAPPQQDGSGALARVNGDSDSDEDMLLHSECMAQRLLSELSEREERRRLREGEVKRLRSRAFGVGWDPSTVSLGAGVAAASSSSAGRNCGNTSSYDEASVAAFAAAASRAMCCLVLDSSAGSASTEPTLEPACAINLEYLATALRVRRLEGREPIFSLDPVAHAASVGDAEGAMLAKRFEPEWLAATGLGEALFQADFHLKELSMGEGSQPVLGMHDCFHYADSSSEPQEWSAREWFVVRKAELLVSDDGVLVPCVKLGVQAREQYLGPDGLEDAPVTSPEHPLVRYAQAFTDNFDLIAERRSVIHRLREVAKASVIAKFLDEASVALVSEAMRREDAAVEAALGAPCCCLEVPRLWRERPRAELELCEGEILQRPRRGPGGGARRVYGGVEFGIDRFRLTEPRALAGTVLAQRPSMALRPSRAAATMGAAAEAVRRRPGAPPSQRQALPRRIVPAQVVAGQVGPSLDLLAEQQEGQRLSRMPLAGERMAQLSGPVVASRLEAAPVAGAAPTAAQRLGGPLAQGLSLVPRDAEDLHGVDLSLAGFNLSESAGRIPAALKAPPRSEPSGGGSSEVEASQECTFGLGFLSCITGAAPPHHLDHEDLLLLRRVFDSSFSDRVEKGEGFAPPATLPSTYLAGLKRLVAEEDRVRKRRRAQFCSPGFSESNPGPLFPSSWKSPFELASAAEADAALALVRTALPRERWSSAARRVAEEGAMVFERRAEDSAAWRIYRSRTLEARTIEVAVAGAQRHPLGGTPPIGEKILAVFALEAAEQVRPPLPISLHLERVTQFVEVSPDGPLQCHSYVVLETSDGNRILMEKLADGSVVWGEDSATLAFRNSLAKILRTADCSAAYRTVLDLKRLHFMEAQMRCFSSSASQRKKYADTAYCRALGDSRNITSGYRCATSAGPGIAAGVARGVGNAADKAGRGKRWRRLRSCRQDEACELLCTTERCAH